MERVGSKLDHMAVGIDQPGKQGVSMLVDPSRRIRPRLAGGSSRTTLPSSPTSKPREMLQIARGIDLDPVHIVIRVSAEAVDARSAAARASAVFVMAVA